MSHQLDTKQSAWVASPVQVSKWGSKEWIKQKHLSFMRTAFPSILRIVQFGTHDRREHGISQTKSSLTLQSPFQQTVIWGARWPSIQVNSATCSSNSCYCKNVWSNWPSLNTRPSSVRLHAHGTRRSRGGDSAVPQRRLAHEQSTRSVSGHRR